MSLCRLGCHCSHLKRLCSLLRAVRLYEWKDNRNMQPWGLLPAIYSTCSSNFKVVHKGGWNYCLVYGRIMEVQEGKLFACSHLVRNKTKHLKHLLGIPPINPHCLIHVILVFLTGLLQIELKTRKTCFWRHQKGKPDTYLSTIEAIYYFLVDYHQEILKENYKGQYDNLLFFFSFMHTLIKNAKCCAGKE